MKRSTFIGVIIAIVLTLFAVLLFYYLLVSNTDKLVAVVYIGILSLVFSLTGYIFIRFYRYKHSIKKLCMDILYFWVWRTFLRKYSNKVQFFISINSTSDFCNFSGIYILEGKVFREC